MLGKLQQKQETWENNCTWQHRPKQTSVDSHLDAKDVEILGEKWGHRCEQDQVKQIGLRNVPLVFHCCVSKTYKVGQWKQTQSINHKCLWSERLITCVNTTTGQWNAENVKKKTEKERNSAKKVDDCVFKTRSERPSSPKSQVYQATSGNLSLVLYVLMVTWRVITITQLCDHVNESQQF